MGHDNRGAYVILLVIFLFFAGLVSSCVEKADDSHYHTYTLRITLVNDQQKIVTYRTQSKNAEFNISSNDGVYWLMENNWHYIRAGVIDFEVLNVK